MCSGKTHATIGAVGGAVAGVLMAKTGTFDASNYEAASVIAMSAVGGVIGGLVPDLDSKKSKGSQAFNKMFLSFIIMVFGINFMDLGELNTIFRVFTEGITSNANLMAFVLLAILGKLSPHRQFTHKIVGTLSFAIVAYFLFAKPIAIGFIVGYIAHLLGDKTTKDGKNYDFFDIKLPCQRKNGTFKVPFMDVF